MKTVIVSIVVVILTAGCEWQKQKQMEQENAELRTSLQQREKMLDQSQTVEKKQKAQIDECQARIITLEKTISDVQLLKAEIRKQMEFATTELNQQKMEVQKHTALEENYKAQNKTLNARLTEARDEIKRLEKQIQALTEKSEARSATTRPFEK